MTGALTLTIHTEMNPMQYLDCDGCDRRFTSRSVLQLHIDMAHPRVQDYAINCTSTLTGTNSTTAGNNCPTTDTNSNTTGTNSTTTGTGDPKQDLFSLLCTQPMVIESMVPDDTDEDLWLVKVRRKRKVFGPEQCDNGVPEKQLKPDVAEDVVDKDKCKENGLTVDADTHDTVVDRQQTRIDQSVSSVLNGPITIEQSTPTTSETDIDNSPLPVPPTTTSECSLVVHPTINCHDAQAEHYNNMMRAANQYYNYNQPTYYHTPQQPITAQAQTRSRHCVHGPFKLCTFVIVHIDIARKRKCVHGAECVERHELCARDKCEDCPMQCPNDHSWRPRLCHHCKLMFAWAKNPGNNPYTAK